MRHNRMFSFAMAVAATLFGIASRGEAVVVTYVNQNATGTNTGGDWANAFTNLQSALAAAPGFSEIWVAKGTYVAGSATTATFTLIDTVKLFGGFNGTETAEPQRDPVVNVTVLSGEIGSPGLADNIDVIVTASSIGSNTVLDGFHIVAAARNGIQVVGASPVLSNLRVTDCGQELDAFSNPQLGGGINID